MAVPKVSAPLEAGAVPHRWTQAGLHDLGSSLVGTAWDVHCPALPAGVCLLGPAPSASPSPRAQPRRPPGELPSALRAGSLTLCRRCPAPALPLAASLQDSNKLTLDFGSLLGPIFYTWLLQLLLPVMLVSLVYEKERR